MQTPFSFDLILVFGFLSAFLMLGIILRARVAFVQRFIIPSCLIGGFFGLIFINIVPLGLDIKLFEAFIYPMLAQTIPFFGVTDAKAALAEIIPNLLQGGISAIIAFGIWRVFRRKT